MPNLVLLGIQGSGKGTQAELLKKNYGFVHLNIGSLLREQMKLGTELGNSVREYMLRGDLVPDEYIVKLIAPILNDQLHGLVLDGFPRTLKQAEFLEKTMPIKYAIYFRLDDDVAKERLSHRRVCQTCQQNYNLLLNSTDNDSRCSKCGSNLEARSDDNKTAINRRISAFHRQTKPVIDFFSERNKLITVNAIDQPLSIHSKLVELTGLTSVKK